MQASDIGSYGVRRSPDYPYHRQHSPSLDVGAFCQAEVGSAGRRIHRRALRHAAMFLATCALVLLDDAGNWIISKARPGINIGQAAENISSNAGANEAVGMCLLT